MWQGVMGGSLGLQLLEGPEIISVGNQSRLEERKRSSYSVYLRRVKLLSSVIRRKSSLEVNGTGKTYKAFILAAPREIWQSIYSLTI